MKALLSFIAMVFGCCILLLAAMIGLVAILLALTEGSAIALGLFAIVLTLGLVGVLLILPFVKGRQRVRSAPQRTVAERPSAAQRKHTGLTYDDFDWAEPPPTRKQFGYAMSLNASLADGMNRFQVSDAIDEAIEVARADEPATKEQLRQIRRMHGLLPRPITRGEARDVIDFLEDYELPCPFCGITVYAHDETCCACERSLRQMKIPIKLPKKKR